ncbi:MAG: DNA polymerase IV [Maricaulaceae bacterium]
MIQRCRMCARRLEATETSCGFCGARHRVAHPELDALAIAHLDCDAFYAAVEKRDRPELVSQPVIVGGGRRGVVATACYLARAFGVRSAMPMFNALRACPQAVVIRPDMAKYAYEGRRVREMMRALTPLVEPLSIDEAFLDLTGTERLHGGPPAQSLLTLARAVETELGITVSIGLSYNKFLAKCASGLNKPKGFTVIGRAEALDFLADKPVDFVYGVGPAFARNLTAAGLRTLGEVRTRSETELMRQFGEAGLRLARLSRGEDVRAVEPDRDRKSISSETTFERDLVRLEDLDQALWALCEKTADRAKAANACGRVVTLKLKTAAHKTLTRRRTLPAPTQLADALYRAAFDLLSAEASRQAFRLLGVGISGLEAAGAAAQDWLAPQATQRAAAERAIDAARAKFGASAVIKGRSLKRDD